MRSIKELEEMVGYTTIICWRSITAKDFLENYEIGKIATEEITKFYVNGKLIVETILDTPSNQADFLPHPYLIPFRDLKKIVDAVVGRSSVRIAFINDVHSPFLRDEFLAIDLNDLINGGWDSLRTSFKPLRKFLRLTDIDFFRGR